MNNEQDLLEGIMNDMSYRQGYTTTSTATKESPQLEKQQSQQHKTSQKESFHPNLNPNVNSMDTNNDENDNSKSICPETGWNGAIWNPLCVNRNEYQQTAVTVQPEIELIRRRCYERYKLNVLNIFIQTRPSFQNNNENGDNEQQLQMQMWKVLPYQTIMEHWHFCLKLEEAQKLKNKSEIIPPVWNDPILISPSIISTPKALELLLSEVEFHWKRQSRQQQQQQQHQQQQQQHQHQHQHTSRLTSLSSSSNISSFGLPPSIHRYVEKQLITRIHDIAIDTRDDFCSKYNRSRCNSNAYVANQHSKKTKGPKIKFNVSRIDFKSNDHSNNTTASDNHQQISITFNGLSLYINKAHYQKLKTIFFLVNHEHDESKNSKPTLLFLQALFSLLCRYDTLAGAGLQSSLTGNVFDVLLKHFSCQFECFASPLNSRYSQFCSAFPDVDAHFGSFGSFFDTDFSLLCSNKCAGGGCFQANPPFVAAFMKEMVNTMEFHLNQCQQQQSQSKTLNQNDVDASFNHRQDTIATNNADAKSKPLMFIVFVPKWEKTAGYERLKQSRFCTKIITLSQKDDMHYYCEGTQHRRKTRYRVASFDTAIFFLMNHEAKNKWPLTDKMIQDLKAAFQHMPNEYDNHVHGEEYDHNGIATKMHETLENPIQIPFPKSKHDEKSMSKENSKEIHEKKHKRKKDKRNKSNPQKEKRKNGSNTNDNGIKKKKSKLLSHNETSVQLDMLKSLGIIKSKSNKLSKRSKNK